MGSIKKAFKKVARVGLGLGTYGATELFGIGKKIKGKTKKTIKTKADEISKLKAEQDNLRRSLFALQEQQYASGLQNRESELGNPLSRW